jgi:hypothetical protein
VIQPSNQSNNEPNVPRPGPGPGPTPPNQLNQQGQQPRPSFWRRNLLWIILLLVIPWGLFLFWQANSSTSGAEPVSYSMMLNQAKAGNVVSVTLTDNSVTGTFKAPVHSDQVNSTGTKFTTTIPSTNENTVNMLYGDHVKITTVDNNNANLLLTLLLQWGPFLILAVIIYFFIRRSSQAQNASSVSDRVAPRCTWAVRPRRHSPTSPAWTKPRWILRRS